MTAVADTHRKQRASHLRWLRIGDLHTSPRSQREFKPSWADALAADFKLEGMGYVVVSHRGEDYFLIDGQHRVAALKILGFDDNDTVQCEVYEGLTEEQEAELFLERNNNKVVAALDKFKVAVHAGRKAEVEIADCVRNQGLRIGKSGIMAVGTLGTIYRRVGLNGLGKTLRIVRDAYGEIGCEAVVLDGVGLVIQRYDGVVNEDRMVKALSSAAGGLNGLLTQTAKTRVSLGQPKPQCLAATAVSFYNRQSGGTKLAPWWKESA